VGGEEKRVGQNPMVFMGKGNQGRKGDAYFKRDSNSQESKEEKTIGERILLRVFNDLFLNSKEMGSTQFLRKFYSSATYKNALKRDKKKAREKRGRLEGSAPGSPSG